MVRTFVRRSIILSNKIFSFLNAMAPGPVIAFFWIGVKISLFQKQVCESTISREQSRTRASDLHASSGCDHILRVNMSSKVKHTHCDHTVT